MPLAYYPSPGEILVCHYDKPGAVLDGEMCKSRPVIVVGPRLRRRGKVVTVVPLSTSEPLPCEPHHWRFEIERPLPPPFNNHVMWAKCDMVGSVALLRLDRFKEPRRHLGGARKWTSSMISAEQLDEVRAAVLAGLGLSTLTDRP